MTLPEMNGFSQGWQQRYSIDGEHLRDLRRIGIFLVPILSIIFLATMYSVVFTFLFSSGWLTRYDSRFLYYLWLARLAITVLVPVALMIGGFTLILRATYGLVRKFYQPPEDTPINRIVWRRMLGVPPLAPPLNAIWRYPGLLFKEPKLDDKIGAKWLGGPATLAIYDGTALYLERGNRFSRVVGPGTPPMPMLERYEIIRAVVDLRPQVRERDVNAWTKDGISVKMTLRMECQMDASSSAREASRNLVYPFDPLAVQQAVEHVAVRYNAKTKKLEESEWVDGIWGQVSGYFSGYVISRTLDELFMKGDEQIFSPKDPKQVNFEGDEIARAPNLSAHIDKINENIRKLNLGAHVVGVQITSVKLPPIIDDQRIQSWESEHLRIAKLRESKTRADQIRTREEIRTQAQHDMLSTITDRLRNVKPSEMGERILLSLTGILDQDLDDPLVRPLIAKESISLLERVREILKEGF